MGRAPGAVATVIDSQPVKAAETVGRDSCGYDGAKKINGRKRHLVVDTKGLPLFVMVTPADMTDRDAAKEVLFRLRLMHPEITTARADAGYAGQLVAWAKKHLGLTLKTVSRPKNTPGFVILPRRWVVERSLAWIMHARRHARLRTADPALRVPDHLGRHRPHDQAHHQLKLPQKRPAGLPRRTPGLIFTALTVSRVTQRSPGPGHDTIVPLLLPDRQPDHETAVSGSSTSHPCPPRRRRLRRSARCSWASRRSCR